MPNVVKGSKQEKMVVVPYRPRQRAFFALLVASGVVLSALGGFMYGYYETLLQRESSLAELNSLNAELAELREENAELRKEVAILDRSSIMDQRANVEVQETMSDLRGRVSQLEQDIVYYRGVIAAETEDTGLTISQMDINATADPNRYRYKLVLRQQDADGDTYLTGHVNVNLVGSRGEAQQIIPLREVSDEQDQLDIRLRFKYFQNIEGELAIPEGFEPERIQIAAISTEPIEKDVSQDFSWVVRGE